MHILGSGSVVTKFENKLLHSYCAAALSDSSVVAVIPLETAANHECYKILAKL